MCTEKYSSAYAVENGILFPFDKQIDQTKLK